MSDRELILARVQAALAPLPKRAPLPQYDDGLAAMRSLIAGRDLAELFAERLALVNGKSYTDPAALAAQLQEGGWIRGYCDPELLALFAPAFGASITCATTYERANVDEFAFGITRAVAAIAETGTLILNDATTTRRLAALAPWVHVGVVRRQDIYADVHQAVMALGSDPNTIWVTGPSKTADVEGILIQGVHGPGAQYAYLV